MATLDWQLRRTGGVTLVELSIRADRDQQVHVESNLTPVWPPRRQGVPVQGWRGDTFEGQVDQDRPLVVGYATPAPPTEPPAEITGTGRPTESEAVTPRTLVRTLGDARPPRDVLPEATFEAGDAEVTGAAAGTATTADGGTTDTAVKSGEPTPPERTPDMSGVDGWSVDNVAAVPTGTGGHGTDQQTADQPPAMTEWFEAVESRLAATQRLADATDADEIREAVEAVGGIETVRSLQAQLDADRRQLGEVRRRSETLADRLDAVELPLATLERVV